MSRVSGHTLGILPQAAQTRWLATLPTGDLMVQVEAGLLAYRKACRLIGMTLPNATTLRLSVAGPAPLRPTYLRDLTLDVGVLYTAELHDAQTEWRATDDGFDLDITIPGNDLPTGRPLVCQLSRTRPSYLLGACADRLNTYRGYQLWRWDYGSRIEDLIGTRAGAADVQRECVQTFTGIAQAELESVVVTETDKFRFGARVVVAGGEEADVDVPS